MRWRGTPLPPCGVETSEARSWGLGVGVHAQCARLGQILWWKPEYGCKPPGYRDVNEAAKNIVVMDSAILQAEAAAGMYKKPIDVPAREVHYDPLPPEVRMVVIAA